MNYKLKNEIMIELENMSIVAKSINELLSVINNSMPDNVQKTALAAFAAQFYNGVENILKRIHKNSGITLPTGDNWHIQLLQRFSHSSDFQLNIKLSKELYDNLNDLRRFRHYFFHGYSINIDWLIIKESISDIDLLYSAFTDSLENILKEDL